MLRLKYKYRAKYPKFERRGEGYLKYELENTRLTIRRIRC